jgi:trimeric autotransporter adhesin
VTAQLPRAFRWACLLLAAACPALPRAQTQSGCAIAGAVVSGRTALPGVVVSLTDADARVVDATASGADGLYSLKAPGPGRYKLTAEFAAFAPVTRDLELDASSCEQRVELTMTLASRAPRTAASPAGAIVDPATAATTAASGGRGARGGGRAQPFQSLELRPENSAGSEDNESGADDAAGQVLPPGFSPETSAESVTTIGASRPANVFAGPNSGDLAERLADTFGSGDAFGQRPFDGAGGGPGSGRGGFAGPGGGPFGRVGRGNQIRGSMYESVGSSALDAAPFALNGQPTNKPGYFQQRLGATVGGPLVIPGVVRSPRTFFFLNYTGNHSRNPFDAYSTVPTLAERAGDLSALAPTIEDPATGRPFPGSEIPAGRQDPAAVALLAFVPLPNQSGDRQNFHTVTTITNHLDDINLRVVRAFGAVPQRGQSGRGGAAGRGGGGRGGPGGGRAGTSNLNIGVHYRRSDNTNANPFPTLGGQTTSAAWDVPVNYAFTRGGLFQMLRGQVNRQRTETQNLYAFNQDVAGSAGILGVSDDPFDFGVPNLSFASFASIRDTNPAMRTDRTLSIGDTLVKTHGRSTWRIGGDYRDIRADSRSDANARGSFVFTGLHTGVDFGDFLLGLPQQASVQFGPGLARFRSRSWDLFAQNDWRVSDRVTVNAGLRYEYFSPLSETDNRLVTLDVAPGFTAAVPVVAGAPGPYSGLLPETIVRPFERGLAPRVGVAWRPTQGTVLRGGYSIHYSASVYQSIAQQLAGQPPFAAANTVLGTAAAPLALATALAAQAPGVTTNSYAVDPDYRLPLAQTWNLDLQRDLTRTVQIGVGYTGTRGSNLDILRAPNRGPDGLRIAGVAPFLFESSEGDSILQSLTLRLRKRMTSGLAAGATYTLSKSIDDASSIGGSGAIVAQNDLDLAAERGLSSFDQRHRLAADFTCELPFGAKKRWFTSGTAAGLFGNWQLNGNLQLASGTPFTARVLGATSDVARGTNGTLRADYSGMPIAISDPTAAQFFNTSAFSIPVPGLFGNAGRNTIIGPGTSVMNLGLTKSVNLGTTRGLSIQVLANNVFNTVQFAAIDTIVNSPTFGQVTAVRPMRRVQILTRFRF